MNEPDIKRSKNYVLLVLAITMLVAGIAVFVVFSVFIDNSWGIVLSMVLILFSSYSVKVYRVRRMTRTAVVYGGNASVEKAYRLGPKGWAAGIILTIAFGFSLLYFLWDITFDGGRQVLPLFLVAIVGPICGIFWAFHFLNWIGRLLR